MGFYWFDGRVCLESGFVPLELVGREFSVTELVFRRFFWLVDFVVKGMSGVEFSESESIHELFGTHDSVYLLTVYNEIFVPIGKNVEEVLGGVPVSEVVNLDLLKGLVQATSRSAGVNATHGDRLCHLLNVLRDYRQVSIGTHSTAEATSDDLVRRFHRYSIRMIPLGLLFCLYNLAHTVPDPNNGSFRAVQINVYVMKYKVLKGR